MGCNVKGKRCRGERGDTPCEMDQRAACCHWDDDNKNAPSNKKEE